MDLGSRHHDQDFIISLGKRKMMFWHQDTLLAFLLNVAPMWHHCHLLLLVQMYGCRFYYQPENQDDVVAIVADCARAKRRLRVLGSGLSPNGVGFSEDGMMSMALLDRVVWVDPDFMRVRCCGCCSSCLGTIMVTVTLRGLSHLTSI
jgi:hypothetical protein